MPVTPVAPSICSRKRSRGLLQGPERAELLWSLGKIKFEGQDTRVGLDFFRLALEETGDDDLLRARILESLTFPAGKQEGFRAAEGYAREAAALAERLGDMPTLARALARLGSLLTDTRR